MQAAAMLKRSLEQSMGIVYLFMGATTGLRADSDLREMPT